MQRLSQFRNLAFGILVLAHIISATAFADGTFTCYNQNATSQNMQPQTAIVTVTNGSLAIDYTDYNVQSSGISSGCPGRVITYQASGTKYYPQNFSSAMGSFDMSGNLSQLIVQGLKINNITFKALTFNCH